MSLSSRVREALNALALEHDLQRVRGRGVGERVVCRHRVDEREVMCREQGRVQPPRRDQAQQLWDAERVHQPGRDSHVPNPDLLQVQMGGATVHADVRDAAARRAPSCRFLLPGTRASTRIYERAALPTSGASTVRRRCNYLTARTAIAQRTRSGLVGNPAHGRARAARR